MKAEHLVAFLNNIAKRGRGGDSILAHINPQEANLLMQHGGSGSINPHTGLPEFMPGQGSSGAGNNSVGGSGSHSNGGGSNGPGGGTGGNNGGVAVNASGNRTSGVAGMANVGAGHGLGSNYGGGNGGGPGFGNDTVATHQQAAALGMTPDHYIGGASNLGQAVTDSYGTNFGRFLAGMFGFNKNVVNQPFGSYANGLNTAGWGFDPAGAVGGLIGTAAGVPFGGGLLADQISKMLGRPAQIALNDGGMNFGNGPHGSGLPAGSSTGANSSGVTAGNSPGGGNISPGGGNALLPGNYQDRLNAMYRGQG